MIQQRVDTIERYFKLVNKFNIISVVLFWGSIFLSIVLLFLDKVEGIKYGISIAFIIITFVYFIVSNILSLYLLRNAQNRRRTHLLRNSLHVQLDNERTQLYYNNNQAPSIGKLGINTFENSLFTWRVTANMVKVERVKVCVYLIIWLSAMLIRTTNLDLIAIIAQTLLTTGLLTNWIKLEILKRECECIFNEFRQFFLMNRQTIDEHMQGLILNLVFRYESIVANMGVHLSSKVFHKINPYVTEEWEEIKQGLNIE